MTHRGTISSTPHLLIAGYGYLGEAIAREARALGWQVTALSRRSSRNVERCDITDIEELEAIPLFPTHLVHCASSGSSGDADRYRQLYLEGMRNLCQSFPTARPCFVSSTSVYGQIDGSVVTEESETQPPKASGRVLLEAEQVALDFGGFVTRLAGIYGPGRAATISRFLDGKAAIEGEGTRLKNNIHRDDAAEAILHLCQLEPNGIYNVADDEPISQKELYSSLCQTFDRPMPATTELRLASKRGWSNKAVSNAKLRATGWSPKHPSLKDCAAKIAPTLARGR